MKLYRATNGWLGNGDIHCYVIAEHKARALEVATEKFKSESKGTGYNLRSGGRLEDSAYYRNIEVECVCEDTDVEWAGEVTD